MAGTTYELLFDDELENAISCLSFWIKEAEKILAKENDSTKIKQVIESSKNAVQFLSEFRDNNNITNEET